MRKDDLQLVQTPGKLALTRPAWVEVSASALVRNYALLLEQAQHFDAEVICVIKANAYGHDVLDCARVLTRAGAPWLAVTSVDEGVELVQFLRRENLPVARVLILGGLFALQDAYRSIRYQLTPVLFSLEQLQWIERAASDQVSPGEKFGVHLEIDTGMARNGVRWDDAVQLAAFAERLGDASPIVVEAVMTHFASPDDPSSPQTAQQLQYFTIALKRLHKLGLRPPLLHAGNSVTLFIGPQADALHELARQYRAQLLFRPGLALYGYGDASAGLVPVLTWKTRITGLRQIQAGDPVSYSATFHAPRVTRIATLGVGYADGYNRLLSNRGTVLVRGQRAPVVGRITMDQTMIDVSAIEAASVGDEVVLLGTQGEFTVAATQLATLTATIAWEVLCNINPRVRRVFVE